MITELDENFSGNLSVLQISILVAINITPHVTTNPCETIFLKQHTHLETRKCVQRH